MQAEAHEVGTRHCDDYSVRDHKIKLDIRCEAYLVGRSLR